MSNNIPQFVNDIFEKSDLDPIYKNELTKYYRDRNLNIVDTIDLSFTLKEYYENTMSLLKENIYGLNKSEKSYYKKVLNQISHESNAYLKLGADRYIGFLTLLLQKI